MPLRSGYFVPPVTAIALPGPAFSMRVVKAYGSGQTGWAAAGVTKLPQSNPSPAQNRDAAATRQIPGNKFFFFMG